MADDSVGRRMPFAFLADLKQKFLSAYSRDRIDDAPAYGMNEFSRTLGQMMVSHGQRW